MKANVIFIVITLSLISGCAGVPNKKDIAIDEIRVEYARQGTEGPVVVFEAGLGGGMNTWTPVFEKVSEFTTAFAYDRRGYGESGKPAGSLKTTTGGEIAKTAGETVLDAAIPGASLVTSIGTMATRSTEDTSPRTGAVVAAELHSLLTASGTRPPYILVGHSLGGLYASLFARMYPDEIAGVVLVDSMHPEQIQRCKEYLPAKKCDPAYYPWWVKALIKMTPGVIKAEMDGMSETGQQIRAAGALPPVPYTVITHGKPPADKNDTSRMWADLQEDLAGESPTCTHIIAKKSGHNIQSDEPDLVVQAIKDVVMQARQGSGNASDSDISN